MKESNKKMIKIFALPFVIFMFYPVALAFKIHYAIDTDQPVMDKNYYEVGSHYDSYVQNLNTGDRTILTPLLDGDHGGMNLGDNAISVEYRTLEGEKVGSPVEGGTITLHMERAATVNQNQDVTCVTNASGRCELRFDLKGHGSWELTVKGEDSKGGRFTKHRTVDVPG